MRDGARIAVKQGVLEGVRQKIHPKHDGRFILEQVRAMCLGPVSWGVESYELNAPQNTISRTLFLNGHLAVSSGRVRL